MSRLTRKETIIIRGNETAACNYENNECNDSCKYGICKWQEKANMRLKKYEDTGLTPEQVQKLAEMNVPKKLNRSYGVFGEKYECPNCGSALVDIDALAGHCKWCGQRVDT